VIDALRGRLAEQGFAELSQADIEAGTEPDRGIVVGPATDARWISVYDELCENQDEAAIRGLAEHLSRGGGTAIGVLDHDSDVLRLWLCQDGQLVDTFDSNPNYFVGVSPDLPGQLTEEELELVRGHADRWQEVLTHGATADQLEGVWREKVVFAEDMLGRLAPLFGWSQSLAATGFNYLSRGDPPFDDRTFTRLSFRAPGNPLEAVRGTGLPRFEQGGGQLELRASIGKPFQGVGAAFVNTGGSGTGLRIVLWGPALELLEMNDISLVLHTDLSRMPTTRQVPLSPRTSIDGDLSLAVAELLDFAIPMGVAGGSDFGLLHQLATQGVGMQRALELQTAARLGLVLSGSGARVGQGELHIGVTPLENAEQGQTSWSLSVLVSDR
jgi:hypothetical protein